ncbi:response regulator, partial [Mycobacterium sp. MAC_080597_8934]
LRSGADDSRFGDDDEPQILRALRINLSVRGYEVVTASTGAGALRAAAEHKPDVVILDLGLPDISGIDVLAGLRGWLTAPVIDLGLPDISGIDVLAGLRGWLTAPVIVLSARTDSSDKVEALDAGADDYVTKPFGMDEFLARLRAAVRRNTAASEMEQPVVETESFTVDLAAKKVTKNGSEVHLTPTGLPTSPGSTCWRAARLAHRAGDRVVRPHRFVGQGRSAGRRGRRLRHQTLWDGRVPGSAAGGGAPQHRGLRDGTAGRRNGVVHRRPGRQEGHQERQRGAPHPTEWGCSRCWSAIGQAGRREELLKEVWGRRMPPKPLPACVSRAAAPQAGKRPVAPQTPADRIGMGYRFEA